MHHSEHAEMATLEIEDTAGVAPSLCCGSAKKWLDLSRVQISRIPGRAKTWSGKVSNRVPLSITLILTSSPSVSVGLRSHCCSGYFSTSADELSEVATHLCQGRDLSASLSLIWMPLGRKILPDCLVNQLCRHPLSHGDPGYELRCKL